MNYEKEPFPNLAYVLSIAFIAGLMSLCSCNVNRTVTGKVTAQKGNMVTIDSGRIFQVYDTSGIFIGKTLTFTPTVNRSKINSRRKN